MNLQGRANARASPTIEVRSYPSEYQRHRHAYHQLVLPLAGVLDVETHAGSRRVAGNAVPSVPACDRRGGTRRIDDGTAAVIPAGVMHGFAAAGANRFVVVDLPGDHDGRLFDRALREPAVRLDCATRHHVAFLSECMAAMPLAETFRRHWTALLLEALESPADETRDPRNAGFDRAARWIEAHLPYPIGTVDVAAAVGLSPARVRALFREQAGCTPRAWIAAARLERAAALLETTDRPISEIALACGFSEQSALTRAFARHFGETPARRRRRRSR